MTKDKILEVKPLNFPWETRDPFLFCAHHLDLYPQGNENLGIDPSKLQGRQTGYDFTIKDGFRMYHGTSVPGFPYHPHRGFETITIGKEGFVDHSDSMGAAGRFGAGDVQWMTAGKGVQHSEMFPLLNGDKANTLEIFQVWLNLPRKSKLVEPYFKMLWNDMIPKIEEQGGQGHKTTIEVITGHYKETRVAAPNPDSWASNPENQVMVLTIKMEAGATWTLPAATGSDLTRMLYFYKGKTISIEGRQVEEYHFIELKPDEEITIVNGDEETRFLLLQGKPINEPVVQHGPFVMNTREEIQQTFDEYQRTQFGGWPWPQKEQTHGKRGRFALHADGTGEEK